MAPISQVACTPITQIDLKRLKHASSIFIDMTGRSRSNCSSQLLSCRTCTRMVPLNGGGLFFQAQRCSSKGNVAGSKPYPPSPANSRGLFWLDGTAGPSREGVFLKKKNPQPSHTGRPFWLNLCCYIMETFKVEWNI